MRIKQPLINLDSRKHMRRCRNINDCSPMLVMCSRDEANWFAEMTGFEEYLVMSLWESRVNRSIFLLDVGDNGRQNAAPAKNDPALLTVCSFITTNA